MQQINILSTQRQHLITSSEYLMQFEKALNSLVRAWNKYRPNDSLSYGRKQDLDWLQSILQNYKLYIHPSSNSLQFWEGCIDGKYSRRNLPEKNSSSLVKILLTEFAYNKIEQGYQLGVQVGWRYARLKEYLLQTRKKRKLEEAEQFQEYQKFIDSIRQKIKTGSMDSVLSFGCSLQRSQ